MAADQLTEGNLADIIRALELIHEPSSTNELRREALAFVESQKENESAVRNGFVLVSRVENPPLVRHFGLTLLDHVLRHTSFTSAEHLRDLAWQLAESIRPEDPPYIRNKISQLWAEIAKRSWGLDWVTMDEDLVRLWSVANLVHKEFVMSVLETLSEDVFYREDTVSSLRGSDLNRALVEVFTPLAIWEEFYTRKENHVEIRCGAEGWLIRTREFLDACIENLYTLKGAKEAALKALAVFNSVLIWSIPKAVISSLCVPSIFRALTCEDEDLRLVRLHFMEFVTYQC